MGKYIKNNRPLNTLGKRESLMEADDRYFSTKPSNDIKIKKFVREYSDEIKDDIDNDMYDEYGMWSKYLDMFIMDFPKNKLTISEFAIKFFDEINKKFGTDFHYGYTIEGLDDYANRWEKKARDQASGITKNTKYYVDGYYDDKYRGLANSEVFDDGDEAFEYAWELLQKGNYIKVNNYYRLSPDDVKEPEDIPVEWFMENLQEALYQATVHCTDGSDPYGLDLYDLESDDEDYIKDYAISQGAYTKRQRKDLEVYDVKVQEPLKEDTVKQGNKWVNKGNTGKTHGEFKTKKQADAQRKAMFVNKKKNSNWGK